MPWNKEIDTSEDPLNLHTTTNRIFIKTGYNKKQVKEIIKAYHEVLREEILSGKSFKITGIGSYYTKYRSARDGFNIHTNEKIFIPETMEPTFKFVDKIKKYVRKNVRVEKGKGFRPK